MNSVRGGLHLDAHTERSRLAPLRPASIPEQVILPLEQHAGFAAQPLVQVGDRVLRGQPVAQPQGDLSAWLHASVAGEIIAIEPRPTPHHGGSARMSIVIRNDGTERSHAPGVDDDPARNRHESLSPAALCEQIARGGIVGLGGATFPTAAKLLRAQTHATHLLINGAECEPWISCDEALMRERAHDVLRGAQILCHALQATQCTIAIEDSVPEARRSLTEALARVSDTRLQLVEVASIYPAGGERQLIAAITGLEVPTDGLPADIGVVCQNVGTAAAVARWINDGEPLLSRIVTITGSAVTTPANLEVRLGTPIASLVADCGGYTGPLARLIMGGSMMGAALPSDDLPVVKGTNCILAATPADLHPRGAERPCIRCGNCSHACPAFLLPQQLHWYAQGGDLDALEQHALLDCIECGCCDYVCPSQIPLTQRFRDAKPALVARTTMREAARDARERFEAREARVSRHEEEQREKLAAKRKEIGSKPRA